MSVEQDNKVRKIHW